MADNATKFRVQAGELLFEIEGPQAFVQKHLNEHREQIETILEEQAKIIKSGTVPTASKPGRRPGRPRKNAARKTAATSGRRPGRQPSIVRDSKLKLKVMQQKKLTAFLKEQAGGGKLGKDATVFAIAYFLCTEVLNSDTFTAGDVIVAYGQVGNQTYLPAPTTVDVVQMLRNLAASSIGKEWVERNEDGTFSLSSKGKKVGESGQIVRPRGRRPKNANAATATKKKAASKKGAKKGMKKGAKKGAKKTTGKRRGRPPKNKA